VGDAADVLKRHIKPGHRVLLGTGAGEPLELERALVEIAAELPGLTLLSGLQLSDYPFMAPVRAGLWSYETWHVMPPIRDDIAAGRVRFHPSRGSLLLELIGKLRPDVFLAAVAPQRARRFSFGASVSYARPMAEAVRTILEVNARMPVTTGESSISSHGFGMTVETDHALPVHRAEAPDEVARRIAEHVRPLILKGATLQMGIGAVPEAVMALIAEDPPDELVLFGMGVDAMVEVMERNHRLQFVGGELLGSSRLYDFAHDNSRVRLFDNRDILSIARLRERPRFVSLQGAIEVDLWGQVNTEFAKGRQVSGAGGGFDFIEGSWESEGGLSIIALPATARGGDISRIVFRLDPGTPVSVPRHTVRYVVTENGIADLFGLSLDQRAQALVSIADPRFRDALWNAADAHLSAATGAGR
jgi:4-hydroxybutyrate CoA-transferase